ncbi:hypothetical protein UlMin_001652 [Ulmus minor]
MEAEKSMVSFLNPNVQLDQFDGTNFTRWKGNLFFLFTVLKIAYKRAEDKVMCRGHILNTLSDRLYDLYNSMDTPKEICTDKFLILKYFEFTMVETKHVLDQIHELQIMLSKLYELKVEISESFNIIEGNNRKRKNNQKNNNTNNKFKKISSTKKIFSGNCFRCGKKGHRISDCKFRKNGSSKKEDNTSNTENVVENHNEELVAMVSKMQVGMITELNMAATKSSNWWLDSRATIHVCNDKSMFSTYKEMKDDEVVLMGNHISPKVLRKGSVDLQFTSRKKLK